MSPASFRTVSARAAKPAGTPSAASQIRVQPWLRNSPARVSASGGIAAPASSSSFRLPARMLRPSSSAFSPRPGRAWKESAGAGSSPVFSRQHRTTARPKGCSEDRSARASQAYT